MHGIKITALDKLFSEYIRTRDNWACRRCLAKHPPPTNALHCAHIFTRSKKSTRFDPENAVALCYGCHSFLDRNPLEKYDWYIKNFSQEKFDRLRLRSNIPGKPDVALHKIWLTQELNKLKTARSARA